DQWGVAHASWAPAETYRPLRTAQCREMAAGGLVTLGAHTHTHGDFRGRPGEMAGDLALSVEVLRERVGVGEATFAFPFGRRRLGFVTDELIEALRATGVTFARPPEAQLRGKGSR